MNVFDMLQLWWGNLPETPAWALLMGKITVILAAGWLLHAALGRANPRWRVLLWRIAVVAILLMPVAFRMGPSLDVKVSRPELVQPPETSAAAASASSALPVGGSSGGVVESASALNGGPVIPSAAVPASVSSRARSMVSWFDAGRAAIAVWVMGILVLGLRWAIGWRSVQRVVRQSAPVPNAVVEKCRRVAEGLGCRAVEPRLTESISTPFLTRWRRPVLLIPARMAADDYGEQLPAILAHELAHVRAGDMLWTHVIEFLRIVLWFHPLAWPVRRAHAAACEEVSDAVSAAYVGDAAAYSRTLARVAVELAELPPPLGGIAMARVPEIMRRLEILRRHVFVKPLSMRRMAVFIVLAMVGAGLLGSLRLAWADDEAKSIRTVTVIVNDENGNPVANQPVKAERFYRDPETKKYLRGGSSLTTDGDGKAVFEKLAEGHWTFSAVDARFGNADDNMRPTLEIPAKSSEVPVRIRLYYTNRSISGVVVDGNNQPVAGAKAVICNHILPGSKDPVMGNCGSDLAAATSDRSGHFELSRLRPGKVSLVLYHPDYAVTWHSRVDVTSQPLHLKIDKGIELKGRVVRDGKPVVDAAITARAINLSHRSLGAWQTRTDATGNFVVRHVNDLRFQPELKNTPAAFIQIEDSKWASANYKVFVFDPAKPPQIEIEAWPKSDNKQAEDVVVGVDAVKIRPESMVTYTRLPGMRLIEQPEDVEITNIQDSPDGRYRAFAARYQDSQNKMHTCVRIWDENKKETVLDSAYRDRDGWIDSFAWLPDSSGLVIADHYSTYVFDPRHPESFDSRAYMDGMHFAIGTFDLKTGKTTKIDDIKAAIFGSIKTYSQDGFHAVTGDQERAKYIVRDYQGGKLVRTIDVHLPKGQNISQEPQVLGNRKQLWFTSSQRVENVFKVNLYCCDLTQNPPEPKLMIQDGFQTVWTESEDHFVYQAVQYGDPVKDSFYYSDADFKKPVLLATGKAMPRLIGISHDGRQLFVSMPKDGVGGIDYANKRIPEVVFTVDLPK